MPGLSGEGLVKPGTRRAALPGFTWHSEDGIMVCSPCRMKMAATLSSECKFSRR